MSALASWMATREPEPPAPLARALADLDLGAPAATDALAALARERLERALTRPGRERASAYRLLEADALFTYACECALEQADPADALRRILSVAGR